MPRVQEFVEVWTSDAGEPERLVWRARRFRVTDMPTALVGPCDWWSPFSDHDVSPGRVPLSISGWRFQASSDDGETHVFDVEHDGAHWHLVRVFDEPATAAAPMTVPTVGTTDDRPASQRAG